VIGPDPSTVRDIAYKVRDVMRQNDKTKDVQLDWNEQSPYLKLVVDQDRARALGLTAGRLAGARHASRGTGYHPSGQHRKVGVVARGAGQARSRPRRRPHGDVTQRHCGAAAADRQDRICP
jgi:multidrug efflux pump subunit AcrB